MPDTPNDSDEKDPRIAEVDQRFAELQQRLHPATPMSWEISVRWRDLARQAMEELSKVYDVDVCSPELDDYRELLDELEILEEITK